MQRRALRLVFSCPLPAGARVPASAEEGRLIMQLIENSFFLRGSGNTDRAWVDGMLTEIRAHMPRMLQDHLRRAEFWEWFCGETDSALSATVDGDVRRYFEVEINGILEDAGLHERFKPSRSLRNPHCVE